MSLWGTHQIEHGRNYLAQLGPLKVWISISEHGWRFAASRDEDDAAQPGAWHEDREPPEDLVKKTWVPPEKATLQIGVRPVLPDRPVVVRPTEPTTVPVAGKFNCFVEVPLSIGLFVVKDPAHLLVSEPSVILSSTWFGLPTDGDLSYAVRSEFKQSVDDLEIHPHTAVCPMRIRNRSTEPLVIERLCLRVQYLSVYQGERFLWTNASSVSYRGVSEWSRLAYGRSAPDFDNAGECLAEPLELPNSRFNLRSFNFRSEPL